MDDHGLDLDFREIGFAVLRGCVQSAELDLWTERSGFFVRMYILVDEVRQQLAALARAHFVVVGYKRGAGQGAEHHILTTTCSNISGNDANLQKEL
jgi:hypothetical protein